MDQVPSNQIPPNEIVLNIDNYDDIFSDFDPRIFSQRSLSDDFLLETKKIAIEKEDPIKLRLLLPSSERNLKVEATIRKRLNEHFQKHAKEKNLEKNKTLKQGFFLIILGIILMFLATFFLSLKQEKLIYNFLIILLEPAGWFGFWEGLHILVFKIKERAPELDFYEKMGKASFIFESY